MNTSVHIALAAALPAVSLPPIGTSGVPYASRQRDWACYETPELHDVCVQFSQIQTQREPNGQRSLVAPFVMRGPNGDHVIEGHYFEATCSGSEVVGAALRDRKGVREAANVE